MRDYQQSLKLIIMYVWINLFNVGQIYMNYKK